jgi:thioredoxin 1
MKLLKFYATWCAPCKGLSQVIETAKDKINIPIEEIDVDQNMDMARKYNIRGVPVMILTDDSGREIRRKVGNVDESTLLNFIGA